MAEKCTNTSLAPSRSMKPKPLRLSNHLMVPLGRSLVATGVVTTGSGADASASIEGRSRPGRWPNSRWNLATRPRCSARTSDTTVPTAPARAVRPERVCSP